MKKRATKIRLSFCFANSPLADHISIYPLENRYHRTPRSRTASPLEILKKNQPRNPWYRPPLRARTEPFETRINARAHRKKVWSPLTSPRKTAWLRTRKFRTCRAS